jgi:hypothetical protein
MSKYFRFQRVEDFDPVLRSWYVTHKPSETYVGEVKLVSAGNFAARRSSDSSFHGTHATRVQAARWLKTRLTSKATFDEDEPSDETDDSD